VSLVDTSQELATLEGALKGVLRDMDTLAIGMKKAQADEIAAAAGGTDSSSTDSTSAQDI